MIVLIDNHDSFAWNLARHLSLLGPRVVVVPSHVATVTDLHRLHPRALVISPGPCTPAEAGCSLEGWFLVHPFGFAVKFLLFTKLLDKVK